jgi:hypothetical protein
VITWRSLPRVCDLTEGGNSDARLDPRTARLALDAGGLEIWGRHGRLEVRGPEDRLRAGIDEIKSIVDWRRWPLASSPTSAPTVSAHSDRPGGHLRVGDHLCGAILNLRMLFSLHPLTPHFRPLREDYTSAQFEGLVFLSRQASFAIMFHPWIIARIAPIGW